MTHRTLINRFPKMFSIRQFEYQLVTLFDAEGAYSLQFITAREGYNASTAFLTILKI